MKTLLFLIFLFLSYTSKSQKIACDSIPWTNNGKLKWSDFKGKSDTTSKYGAVSYNTITYELSRGDDTVNIYLKCFFSPCNSWRKQGCNDEIGLIHEQTHFNIVQYFKRLFIKRILEKEFSRANIVKELKEIYETIVEEWDIVDKKYDAETDYSRNKKLQYRWAEKCNKLIDGLNNYDKSEIHFILRS